MLSRSTAWAVALVATLTMTVSYIDRNAFAVLAPAFMEELAITPQMYGWLVSAFSLAYLVGTPIAGRVIDHVGARRGLVSSVLAWSIVAALHAIAPTFGMLFALRIALGLAESPSFPGAAQTVQRVLSPADRARGFGVLFTGSSVGGMLVPILATMFLAATGEWRYAFVGTAAVGLVWLPLWIVLTRNRAVRTQLDTVPPSDLPARPPFTTLIIHPTVIRGLCAIFAAAPVVGFAQGWGSTYLVHQMHVPLVQVGEYLWMPPLMFDAGAVVFGDLASRQHREHGAPPRLLLAIAMIVATTIAWLPFATTPWQAMWLVGIAMAGGGGMYTLATADLLARMPPECVSTASGILAAAQSLVLVIAGPLIGLAVGTFDSYDQSAVALGVWVLPGALAWLVWRPGPFVLPPRAIVSTSRR
ncbi:MAG TPA: MFS transporter [Kofleriaceae bacterium]|nr:MFS transporter [Kofleriaceae bacterium]